MLKKLSLSLLCAGISTVALAHSPDHHKVTTTTTTHSQTNMHNTTSMPHHHGHYFKSGFMAGVHAGYSHGHGRFDSSFTDNTTTPPTNATASSRARSSSVLFGVHGGYLHMLHNGYTLGGQLIFSMFGNSKMSTNVDHSLFNRSYVFSNSLKRNYTFTPSLNVGKVFWHCYHAYVGLGMGITRFEHEVTNTTSGLSVKSNNTKIGFVPSLGLDYALDHHFIIGTNLSYEFYRNVNNTYNSPDVSTLVNSSYNSKIRPQYFNARIGITYKF